MGLGMGLGIGLGSGSRNWTAQYKSEMVFWGGDFDFDNNLWLDRSGNNNNASLVATGCLQILADTTITLSTPRIGATISKVNESALNLLGVSVNGSGHIFLDQSEITLTDDKIWSIELSTGEVFIFQTMASIYVFANGNLGTLSGTELTTWAWSTSDNAYAYHLKDGFSKYPFSASSYKVSVDDRDYFLKIGDVIEYEWEGWLKDAEGALFSMQPIYNVAGTTQTYRIVAYLYRTTGILLIGSRDLTAFTISTGLTNLSNRAKVKIVINGGDLTDRNNYSIYYNDALLGGTKTVSGANYDRSFTCWAGNGIGNPVVAVRNHWFSFNGQKVILINDGIYFEQLMQTKNPTFIYVPVFNGIDALGFTPTNPSYTASHNKAESKVKMKEVSDLINNDVNNYLFTTGTANSLNMSQMYSDLGNKIHCDNSSLNKIENLIVTKSALDLSKYINGFEINNNYYSIRTDTDGENEEQVGSQLEKLSTLVNETNSKINTHTTHLFSATPEKWGALIDAGKMSISIHDFMPSFWKYATYEEGKYVNDYSTVGEKVQAVTENQGLISNIFSTYRVSKERIEMIHTDWVIPYPNGVTPQDTDDNSMWWEWVIDAFIARATQYGGSIDGISELGAFPNGLHSYHPDVFKLLYQKGIISGNPYGKEDSIFTDNLINNQSIFTGSKNASIVDDGGTNVQKLTGFGADAYGQLNLGSLIAPTYLDVEFLVKSVQGVSNPFSNIILNISTQSQTISFGANLTNGGVNYTNPCLLNTWYKVRITQDSGGETVIRIIDTNDTVLLITRKTASNIYFNRLLIYCLNTDCYIKNVIVRSYYANYPIVSNCAYDQYTPGHSYAQHITKLKNAALNLLMRNNNVAQLFSHTINDPIIKAADSTEQGILDRSYLGFKEIIDWINQYSCTPINDLDLKTLAWKKKRINHVKNNNLNDNIFGLTGSIWGLINVSKDLTETLKYGVNVGKITSGQTSTITVKYHKYGIKKIRLYLKGNIRVQSNFLRYYSSTINTASAWSFVEIFYYVPESHSRQDDISIIALADTFIQKIEIEELR